MHEVSPVRASPLGRLELESSSLLGKWAQLSSPCRPRLQLDAIRPLLPPHVYCNGFRVHPQNRGFQIRQATTSTATSSLTASQAPGCYPPPASYQISGANHYLAASGRRSKLASRSRLHVPLEHPIRPTAPASVNYYNLAELLRDFGYTSTRLSSRFRRPPSMHE